MSGRHEWTDLDGEKWAAWIDPLCGGVAAQLDSGGEFRDVIERNQYPLALPEEIVRVSDKLDKARKDISALEEIIVECRVVVADTRYEFKSAREEIEKMRADTR